jgi:isochorismate hydrolase
MARTDFWHPIVRRPEERNMTDFLRKNARSVTTIKHVSVAAKLDTLLETAMKNKSNRQLLRSG